MSAFTFNPTATAFSFSQRTSSSSFTFNPSAASFRMVTKKPTFTLGPTTTSFPVPTKKPGFELNPAAEVFVFAPKKAEFNPDAMEFVPAFSRVSESTGSMIETDVTYVEEPVVGMERYYDEVVVENTHVEYIGDSENYETADAWNRSGYSGKEVEDSEHTHSTGITTPEEYVEMVQSSHMNDIAMASALLAEEILIEQEIVVSEATSLHGSQTTIENAPLTPFKSPMVADMDISTIDLSTSPFICNESTPTSADGVVPDNNIPSQATQGAYQEPLPYYSNVEPAPPCWPIPRGHIVSPWEPYGFDREDIYHGTRPETGLLLPTITPTLADQTVPGDKLVFDPRGRSWCNYENHKDQWLGTANWHLYDRNYLIPPFHEWTEHCPKVKDWKVCDCETCEEDGVGVYAPGYWEWKERQDRLAEEELPWLEDEVEACDCGEVEEDQGVPATMAPIQAGEEVAVTSVEVDDLYTTTTSLFTAREEANSGADEGNILIPCSAILLTTMVLGNELLPGAIGFLGGIFGVATCASLLF